MLPASSGAPGATIRSSSSAESGAKVVFSGVAVPHPARRSFLPGERRGGGYTCRGSRRRNRRPRSGARPLCRARHLHCLRLGAKLAVWCTAAVERCRGGRRALDLAQASARAAARAPVGAGSATSTAIRWLCAELASLCGRGVRSAACRGVAPSRGACRLNTRNGRRGVVQPGDFRARCRAARRSAAIASKTSCRSTTFVWTPHLELRSRCSGAERGSPATAVAGSPSSSARLRPRVSGSISSITIIMAERDRAEHRGSTEPSDPCYSR